MSEIMAEDRNLMSNVLQAAAEIVSAPHLPARPGMARIASDPRI